MKLLSKKDWHSLRTRMFFWAFVFVLPILFLFIYSTNMAARSYEEQIQANLQQLLIPFAREIDVTLENTRRYIANKRIDTAALESGSDELSALRALMAIGDGFSEDLSVHSQVDAIFFFRDGKIQFVQNYNRSYPQQRKAADAFTDFLLSREDTDSLFSQGYTCLEADGTYYFCIAIDLPGDNVVGCWFDTDTLLAEIRSSHIDGLYAVMFTDRTGRMLNESFNTRSSKRLGELLSPYLVVHEQLASGAYALTALLDTDIVYAPITRLNRMVLYALLAAFVLFVFYIGFMRGSIIRPLSHLIDSIKTIQTGNFKSIPISRADATEIQDVYKALNTMTQEVEILKIRVYEEKLTQQHTQMQLFQLQLKPHFFLNALNTILSFARANEYEPLQKMTLALAKHCRYILYNAWFVSVEEELAYTQNYIDMQSMQHDTKYRYLVEAADSLLDAELPILAVQIFVENALKHSRDQASEIAIHVTIARVAQKDGPYLHIAIKDTGIGFPPEMLSMLNDPALSPPADGSHGIGIENVRKRLEILYGDQARIVFSNTGRCGALVEMRLPMDRKRS